jgi:hypothetical protein
MNRTEERTSTGSGGLVLERRPDGRLWAVREGRTVSVYVRRCFPWSAPARYVSLRDAEEEEVALIADPRALDPSSREALDGALLEAGFVLEVTGIEEIEEDFEIRCWEVHTSHGRRRFQTPLEEWPRAAPGGGLLVEDVCGDLYWIPQPDRLDARSQRLLWAFVD